MEYKKIYNLFDPFNMRTKEKWVVAKSNLLCSFDTNAYMVLVQLASLF